MQVSYSLDEVSQLNEELTLSNRDVSQLAPNGLVFRYCSGALSY